MSKGRTRGSVERGLVAASVGENVYAVDIDHVQEIIIPAQLTPLPHPPLGIIGAIDHRGEIVPILDLGLRFGFGLTEGARRKWILVRPFDRLLGLVVDQVHEVFHVQTSDIRPAPEIGDASVRSAREVVAWSGSMAFLLDVDALARLAEMAASEEASA